MELPVRLSDGAAATETPVTPARGTSDEEASEFDVPCRLNRTCVIIDVTSTESSPTMQ